MIAFTGVVVGVFLSPLPSGQFHAKGKAEEHRTGVNSVLDTAAVAQGSDVGGVSVVDDATREHLVHDVTFAFVVKAFHPAASILTDDGWLDLAGQ